MQSIQNKFLWKHIDIDEELLTEVRQQYTSALPNNNLFFQQIQIELKSFLGLEIAKAILIQAPPKTRASIHTDYRADDRQLALNISLINCQHSITEMWECRGEPEVTYTPSGVPYNSFSPNVCRRIADFRLVKPVLFNTKVPHSVYNYSDQPRIAISLRFVEDPWHLVSER